MIDEINGAIHDTNVLQQVEFVDNVPLTPLIGA
jgi:hypothetical protein